MLEPLLLWRRVRGYEVGLGLITMVGLYLVSQAELDQLLGLGVAVVSAGLSALFSVLNSKLIKTHPPLRLTFYEMLGACLSIGLFLPGLQPLFHAGAGLAAGLARLRLAVAGPAGGRVHGVRLFDVGGADEAPFSLCREPDHQPGAGVRHSAGGCVLVHEHFGMRRRAHERMAAGFYWGTLLIVFSVLIHPLVARLMKDKAPDLRPTPV